MTVSLDGLDALPRAGGTGAGSYAWAAPNVLLAIPRPGYVQTVEAARASLAEVDRIAKERRHKQAVIVLVDRVLSQDAGSRRVWSAERADESRYAQALVCASRLARAIGSFYLGLNRGPVPTKMFGTLEEAVAWCTSLAESSDEQTH